MSMSPTMVTMTLLIDGTLQREYGDGSCFSCGGTDAELGGWSDRFPPCHRGAAPMRVEPRMTLDQATRCETFRLPTIEPERLLRPVLDDRLPALADAFHP